MTVENVTAFDDLNQNLDLNFYNYKYINNKLRLLLISIALYFVLFFVLYSFLQFKTHDQIIAFSPNVYDHSMYTVHELQYLVLKSCLWQPTNNATCPNFYELIMTIDICQTTTTIICMADNITQHYDNTFYPNCQSLNSLNNIIQSDKKNYNIDDYYLDDYIILNAEPNPFAMCGIILSVATISLIILSYVLITRQYSRCTKQSEANNIENKSYILLIISTLFFILLSCSGPIFIITDSTVTSLINLIDLNCSSIDFFQNYMNFVQQTLVNYHIHLDQNATPIPLFVMVAYIIISICIVAYNVRAIIQIKK